MVSPEQVRTVESNDCAMMVEQLPNGKFLVHLQSLAISMRISISANDVHHLFGRQTQGDGAHPASPGQSGAA